MKAVLTSEERPIRAKILSRGSVASNFSVNDAKFKGVLGSISLSYFKQ